MRLRIIAAVGLIIGAGAPLALNPADGQIVAVGPKSCSAVALTYDLCPVKATPGFDAELIEFLKNREVPATFFMSGRWIARHDTAVKELLAVPFFEVGTHGNVHAHLPRHDPEYQQREIAVPITMLKAKYGYHATLFRPPYGEFNDATLDVVSSLGLQFIMWSIESGDPDPTLAADAIVGRIKRRLKPGSIIVLHANGRGRHTKEVTETLITTVLPEKGLRPMTISELLSCNGPAD